MLAKEEYSMLKRKEVIGKRIAAATAIVNAMNTFAPLGLLYSEALGTEAPIQRCQAVQTSAGTGLPLTLGDELRQFADRMI